MRTWPLGMACVAAATRQAGHEVELLDLMGTKNPHSSIKETIRLFRPDLIGVSVETSTIRGWTSRFPAGTGKRSRRDLQGSFRRAYRAWRHGLQHVPGKRASNLNVDMGIQGEGEMAFPALLERIAQGTDLSEVPGLYLSGRGAQTRRIFVRQLDQFPLPTPDLLWPSLQADQEFWLPVQTRRGCPMNCSYCSTATIEGCHIRKRSPETVVEWLHQWAELGFRRFYFVDNTFNLPPSYAKETSFLVSDYFTRHIRRCICTRSGWMKP